MAHTEATCPSGGCSACVISVNAPGHLHLRLEQAVRDWLDAACPDDYGDGGKDCCECPTHDRLSDRVLDALDALDRAAGSASRPV